MSSQAQGGPSVPKDKEKRLSRVLTRVKTVFRKVDSKRFSKTAAPGTSEPASAAPASDAKAAKHAELVAQATKVPRAQIYEDRAKKLGERFGLEIKASEWYSTEGHALRVEKPIRMRVHRECHKCGHTFGSAKECPSCKHPRCKQCQRRPPKKTEAEKEESRRRRAAILKERAENQPIIPDWDTSRKKVVLRRPAKQGGQDLVHKKPRLRVRRTCCQCETLYTSGNKICTGCQHARCADCPRDPAKKNKYPYGYPGDEPGVKNPPHYECHACFTPLPLGASIETTSCPKCSHKMCNSCKRIKPRKIEPEPDPEVWKSIQAKMQELTLK